MTELRVPKETVNDEFVVVVRLHAEPNAAVEAGAIVAELETSKANVSLEAEVAGKIAYHCAEGDQLPINGLVATIGDAPGPQPGDTGERAGNDPVAVDSVLQSCNEPSFSGEAESLVKELGLDRKRFAHLDFVRAADVRSAAGIGESAERTGTTGAGPAADTYKITPPHTAPLYGGSLSDLVHLIGSDLHRYGGARGLGSFCRRFLGAPGFRVSCLGRVCDLTRRSRWLRFTIHPFTSLLFRWNTRRYGIRLPLQATIGSGLYIGHWGGIWINPQTVIGRDCNLSQEVSIGSAGRESQLGHPVIGDRVFIGPGAKISGPIRIGRNVVIAANSLVTSNIPDNSIVVGVPAHVIATVPEDNGYISHTDYPGAPARRKDESPPDSP